MDPEPWPEYTLYGGWRRRPPAPIVPVPAAGRTDLRGARVIVGLPGLGWRADLRADDPVVQGSRTYVPVLGEQEWYRAETEQIEVFAPLVPIERVWRETIGTDPVRADSEPDPHQRLVSLDAPPRREPVPAPRAGRIAGLRVVRMIDAREQRGLRVVTEFYGSAEGDICVRVATETEWYRWAWTGNLPGTLEVPADQLWVE